ncbi:ABC transporter substrate-binding protein [Amycolatopsis granulosa]|uniref:ABC transporter substrate-binding protein n=1 Tax=Amycolatopsis granulosa TaxID=185684 RepID=UPI0014233B88|nr:ABC transporter substrate-binding protein [Amycolatopsis granulosa]NIH84011.1 NitT/TauT family transport system substrate-binding protein [Amycolatopsis granulosa]
MGISRRAALRAGLALGAAGGVAGIADLAAAVTGGPAAVGRLRIGYLPITDSAPLLVAHEQGHFARAGLATERPVLFRAWESLAQAFLAGEVDAVHLLMPFAVQLRYALGADVKVLAWNHTNGSALTVARGMRDLRELAGGRIAIPFWWSIHNVLVQRMLRAAGLTPVVRADPDAAAGTVQLLVLSPADMVPALDTGRVGGYIVADPFNAAAEAKKAGRILRFVGDVWRDHACCVVVVRESLIRQAPEKVQALTDGLARAQQWIDGARGDAAVLLSGKHYLPQPLPAITRALTYPDGYGAPRNPDWRGQRIGFAPYPHASYTRELVTQMRGTVVDGDTSFLDRLDPATVHTDLVDDRFIRRTLTLAGTPARTEEVRP